MKYKISVDSERVLGAIGVLENYIIGALADYEDGQVEDTTCLEDSIYVYNLLELVSTHGWHGITKDEYQERFEKAKEKQGG